MVLPFFLFLSFFANAVSFGKFYFYAKILGPLEFGYFVFLSSFSAFSIYLSSLGCLEGLAIKYPIEKCNLVKEKLWSATLKIFFLSSVFCFFFNFSFLKLLRPDLPFMFLSTFFLFLLNFVCLFSVYLQINELKIEQSMFLLLKNSFPCAILLFFSKHNYFLIIVSEVLGIIISILLFTKKIPFKINYGFYGVKKMMTCGLLITGSTVVLQLFNVVDRMGINAFYSIEKLSIYGFAMGLTAVGFSIQNFTNIFFTTTWLRKLSSKTLSFKDLKERIVLTLLYNFLFITIVILFSEQILQAYFPKFIASKKLIYVGCAASFFISFSYFDFLFFYFNKQKKLLLIYFISLLYLILTCFICGYFKKPIEWYGYAVICARALILILGWYNGLKIWLQARIEGEYSSITPTKILQK